MLSHEFLPFVTLLVLGTFSVYANIDEELEALTAAINHLSQECGKELGIAPEKVEKFVWDVNADYEPCHLNCLYAKPGVIYKGIYDKENAMAFLKLYIKNEERLAKLDEGNEICKKVNDVDISEEDTSCKRAALLYKCMAEQEE